MTMDDDDSAASPLTESIEPAIPTASVTLDEETQRSNQATARRAKQILIEKTIGYRDVNEEERATPAQAFAAAGYVIYGKAFDLIRISGTAVDLSDLPAVREAVRKHQIVLIEVKATSVKARGDDFRGHFFSMSTAELLVAQSLRELFRFVFVHTASGAHHEVTLRDVMRRAGAIYPTWSIRLDEGFAK